MRKCDGGLGNIVPEQRCNWASWLVTLDQNTNGFLNRLTVLFLLPV